MYKPFFAVTVTLILGLAIATSSQADENGLVSGRVMNVNDATGEVTVTEACIDGQNGSILTARTARFTARNGPSPSSMSLEGNVKVQDGATVFQTERATYFPDTGVLEADKLKVSGFSASSATQAAEGRESTCQRLLQAAA